MKSAFDHAAEDHIVSDEAYSLCFNIQLFMTVQNIALAGDYLVNSLDAVDALRLKTDPTLWPPLDFLDMCLGAFDKAARGGQLDEAIQDRVDNAIATISHEKIRQTAALTGGGRIRLN